MLNRRDFLSKSLLSLSAGVILPYEKILGKKPPQTGQTDSTDYPLKDLLKDPFLTVEKRHEREGDATGVATGFIEFDKLTDGLQPSELIIVTGRPCAGKTAFGLNIARYAAAELGVPVAIYSLEMSKELLVQRMLSSEAKVDLSRLYNGNLNNEDMGKIARACGALLGLPIYINDTAAMTVSEILADAKQIKMRKGLGLVIVDYLQLVRGKSDADNREKELLNICRSLKAMAKELHVPVVAFSYRKRLRIWPHMARLRELGELERHADMIVFIHRQEIYEPCECPYEMPCDCGRHGTADIIVAKQRKYPASAIKLKWLNEFVTFENLALKVAC